MKHSREDIIEGGIELLRLNGYQGTGVQEILTSMNIPKGSFYNYFKSKEDFLTEMIDLYSSQGMESQRNALQNTNLTPLNRIKKHLDNVKKSFIEENFQKSCLLDILAIEISGTNLKIASLINTIFEERKKIFTQCINEGQEVGEIRKDENAESLAEFLLTGYSGAQLKAKTEKSIRPMNVFDNQYFKYISI